MKQYIREYIFTAVFMLVALGVLIGLVFNSFYQNVQDKSLELSEASLFNEKDQMTSYISSAVDCVRITAIQIEYMMEKNAENDELLDFLIAESKRYTESIDENFTGIYGWFNGEYLDGIGWVPEEGYVPTERDWYKEAYAAKGETVLVSPYVDAKTGNIMISISQLLNDGESVLSLDIKLDKIQQLAEQSTLDGIGYSFVCDSKGLIIAHSDIAETGKNYGEEEIFKKLMANLDSRNSTSFEMKLNGKKATVFGVEILNGWYVVMMVTNESLYSDLHEIILKVILISVIVLSTVEIYLYAFAGRERKLIQKLYKSSEDLKRYNLSTLRALTRAIEAKDTYTKGHSSRVARYSQMLAARMGKTEEEQENVYNIALLHDVGKLRVPENIINKVGKLTDEEFKFIQLHPVAGYNILRDIQGDEQLALGAKFHHERYDGKGYPNGLSGENIPELARIIAVADAYDAMASNRSYRDALPQTVVREEIEKGIGTQFDPRIAKMMLDIIDEDKNYELKEHDKLDKVILIVDDSNINIIVAENILKTEKRYRVIKADSGKQAIEEVSNKQIDLVLLDIEMPEMDGFETLKKIREISDVPVIFMTADKDLATINRATEMGVEDYVTKPFAPPILLESIYGALYCVEDNK